MNSYCILTDQISQYRFPTILLLYLSAQDFIPQHYCKMWGLHKTESAGRAEFGGSYCDTVKVYINAARVINELASKIRKRKTPKVFIVLSHKTKLSFETLTLIDDCTCVRTRHAKIKAPTHTWTAKASFC